jgi:hypothetical protein
MEFFRRNCTKCAIVEKVCRPENGKGPKRCPTKTGEEALASAM